MCVYEKEREIDRGIERELVCVCVCERDTELVCMRVRERDREEQIAS